MLALGARVLAEAAQQNRCGVSGPSDGGTDEECVLGLADARGDVGGGEWAGRGGEQRGQEPVPVGFDQLPGHLVDQGVHRGLDHETEPGEGRPAPYAGPSAHTAVTVNTWMWSTQVWSPQVCSARATRVSSARTP